MHSRRPGSFTPRFNSTRLCRPIVSLANGLLSFAGILVFAIAFSSGRADAATLKVTTASLPAGYVTSAYSSPLAASGGSGTGYTWSISVGSLPSGLTLASGNISGTPKAAATSSFTVEVTDSARNTATAKLSILVGPALKISTAKLADGYVGTLYSVTLATTGGSGTGLAWSVSGGTLPKGLKLAATTGILTGKPTAAATSSFTIQVKDSAANVATAKVSLLVDPALAITTTALTTSYIGIAYSDALAATGGTSAGYKWTIATGTLPAGLVLSAAKGAITGKPVAIGSSKITVKVTDSLANIATAALTIAVNPDLSITTSKLAVAYATSKYSAKLVAAGGSKSGYVWHLSTGTLPAGLVLSTAGVITGAPSAAGSKSISVEVKDSASNTATTKLTITVDPGLTITTGATLPVGYVGTPYTEALAASGGSGTGLKWTTSSKLSAADLSFTGAGVISGDPTAPDTLTIDVKVTDSAANSATATLTLRLNPAIAACSNDAQGTAYVELHGVYTFSLSRFNLGSSQRSYSVGSFNADGLGNIGDGVMDSNGPQFAAEVQNSFTGSYTVGSDGRGAMTMVVPPLAAGSKQVTYTFCFALDGFGPLTTSGKPNPNAGHSPHATLIEDDTTNNVAAGEFNLQTFSTLVPAASLKSLKGTWVVAMAGRRNNTAAGGSPDYRQTTVGYITLDGLGKVTAGEVDQNIDGVNSMGTFGNLYNAKLALTGTYTLPAPVSGTPTGRGTITVAKTGAKGANFILYPAGAGYFVLLESDPATAVNSGEALGVFFGGALKQTGTSFTNASLIGSSVRSRYSAVGVNTTNESGAVGLDVAQWDGKGNFTYTGDANSQGTATTTSGSGTYTVDGKGRFAVMVGGVCSPCGYLTKADVGYAIYNSTAGEFESLEFQDIPVGGPFEIASLQGGYSLGTRWFIYPEQQTVTGELVSDGAGNITGTLDQNQQGESVVNQATMETESSDANSAVHGRFLLYDNTTSTSYALYIVNKNEAITIPLGGVDAVTHPLNVFTHQ